MVNLNGKNYKLVFLDTNALREITLNSFSTRQGFAQRFFNAGAIYAPCFSFYNVVELLPYTDIYDAFTTFFSIIPCFMFFPEKTIAKFEYSCFMHKSSPVFSNEIANAFSPFLVDGKVSFRSFLDTTLTSSFRTALNHELDLLPISLEAWTQQRVSGAVSASANAQYTSFNDQYYLDHEYAAIIKDIQLRGLPYRKDYDIYYFPSLRIFEYSQYSRAYLTSKEICVNDTMDVEISGAIPYVDAAITERFQAGVLQKAKKIIPQLKDLEIFTLKDIRISNTK